VSTLDATLAAGRRQIETMMIDAGRIVWDREGSTDDTIDYDTGQPVRPVDDDEIIYDEHSLGTDGRPLGHRDAQGNLTGWGGKMLIAPLNATRAPLVQIAGGVELTSVPYELWVPVDTQTAGAGGILELTYASQDPGLAGRQFRIRSAQFSTFGLARGYVAEERERGSE
jgi:hypothetical protein